MSATRVLLVTRNLPPLVGGMERLNWHMAEELAKVAELRIIGPQGSAALAPEGVIVREAPLKPLASFLWHARVLARREARAWRPNLVLAGSGLTAPLVRAAAKVCNARTAAYVHGLDVAVKHPVYHLVWLPAIRRMDRVIANSRATADLCRGNHIAPGRIGIVHPGVDLPQASAAGGGLDKDADFRRRHRLENRTILLSVGRLSARKGLREFVTRALPAIVDKHPDVMLLIVGDAPKQALHARAQTPESIQAATDAAGMGDHLRFLGTIPDAELEAAWRSVDVHVFPVRDIPGDPEGFGMVAVEAAARGLPTVAFATGGVMDAVAEGASGVLVPPGDYRSFADAVLKVLSSAEITPAGCTAFARQFAWSEFGRRLWEMLSGTAYSNPQGPR